MRDGTLACSICSETIAANDAAPHTKRDGESAFAGGTRSRVIRGRVSIKSEPRNVKAQESLARRTRRIFLAIDQSFGADFIHGEQKGPTPPKYSATPVASVRAFLLLLPDKAHTWDAYSEGHLTRPLETGSRGSAITPRRSLHYEETLLPGLVPGANLDS
jgi:hypothetical protein